MLLFQSSFLSFSPALSSLRLLLFLACHQQKGHPIWIRYWSGFYPNKSHFSLATAACSGVRLQKTTLNVTEAI